MFFDDIFLIDHPNKFQLFEEYKADGRADGMCSVTSAVYVIPYCRLTLLGLVY